MTIPYFCCIHRIILKQKLLQTKPKSEQLFSFARNKTFSKVSMAFKSKRSHFMLRSYFFQNTNTDRLSRLFHAIINSSFDCLIVHELAFL